MLRRRAGMAFSSLVGVEALRFASMEKSESHTTSTAITQFFLYDAMRLGSFLARRRHDADCRQFEAVQAELLRARLAANQTTAYGRDHNFDQILSSNDVVASFRAMHPLTRPAHYQKYVERIAAGEPRVINAEPEAMLAATSGTSGTRTLLPYTPTMRKEFFTKGILVVFDTLRQSCPEAFASLQRTCKLAFAPVMETTPAGLLVGPNSSGPKDASFKRLLPLYSTPAAGYEIANDEYTALYVHALFALRDRKLGLIEANFISLPTRFMRLIHRDGFRLADDLEAGMILNERVASRLEPAQLAALNNELGGANPARAGEVRAALAHGAGHVETGKRGDGDGGGGGADGKEGGGGGGGGGACNSGPRTGLARRLWPDLRLFNANGTGAFESYAARLRSNEGVGVPVVSTLLAASEGLMGVSLHGAGPDGALEPKEDGDTAFCLVPGGMFFEFLPVGDETSSAAAAAATSGGERHGGASQSGAGGGSVRASVGGRGGGAAAAGASGKARGEASGETGGETGGDVRGGTLLANELAVGTDYELVVTNLGGLCRFRIGDVVRVVGFHERAPLVQFRYRIGQLLNLRGEKLSEPQFERALQKALHAPPPAPSASAQQVVGGEGGAGSSGGDGGGGGSSGGGGFGKEGTREGSGGGLLVAPTQIDGEYAVVEEFEVEPPRYCIYFEPSAGAPAVSPAAQQRNGDSILARTRRSVTPSSTPAAAAADLSTRLDAQLCEENSVYATWRRKRAIGPGIIHLVPPGGFEALRAQRLKEGASPTQLKVSRVLRDPTHIKLLREWRAEPT